MKKKKTKALVTNYTEKKQNYWKTLFTTFWAAFFKLNILLPLKQLYLVSYQL